MTHSMLIVRAGSELTGEGLVVQILAPIVHILKCPSARQWTRVAPERPMESALGSRVGAKQLQSIVPFHARKLISTSKESL